MTGNTTGERRIIGSLRTANGTGIVRMEDRFDTDIHDLWSAFTDSSRLARWLGEVEGGLRLGGEFRARFFASGWEGTGRVDKCEAPRHFLVVTRHARQTGEHEIEVTLTADAGQASLVLEERGMPVDLLAPYGAGIQIHVEDLADYIAGRELREAEVRWDALEVAYRELATGVS